MEREHEHSGGGGGGAPVVVNVQGGAPQMLIKPPPNCCMKCCCPPCAVWMHEVRMPLVDSTPLSPASPPPAIYPVGRLSLTACRLSLCRAWAATSSWPSSPGCAALAGASPCAAGCRTRTASSRAWRSPTWSAKLSCSPSRSAGKGEEACTSTVQMMREEKINEESLRVCPTFIQSTQMAFQHGAQAQTTVTSPQFCQIWFVCSQSCAAQHAPSAPSRPWMQRGTSRDAHAPSAS